jgi:AcrR family transcriptional regulator
MQIKKDDIRELILQVSKDLFLEKGYKKTTLNDISYRSQVSKSNIYNYFKSKNDIFHNLTLVAEKKLEFISDFLAQNTFTGDEKLQEAILFILFEQILPEKDGMVLLFERDVEEGKYTHTLRLLSVVNSMVSPNLTIPENSSVLKIVSSNLVKGYVDILKSKETEATMRYQIITLTEYHVGGLAYLKQSMIENKFEEK